MDNYHMSEHFEVSDSCWMLDLLNLESKQHLTLSIFTAKWMNTCSELGPTRDSGEF